MRDRLAELRKEGLASVDAAPNQDALRALEVELLGKKGRLTALLKGLGSLDATERPAVGRLANQVKDELREALEARRKVLASDRLQAALTGPFDTTLPGSTPPAGGIHPVTRVQRELEDLFTSMGFVVADGPELETEGNNFDALNIPKDHPAREAFDTIWSHADGACMRTHTSPVQIRAMRRWGAPLRVVAPGRCFRQETQDATHEHTFHQMEGLVVGEGIAVPHMLHAMQAILERAFGVQLETRLRPGFFPFVEPGFELDARCPFCEVGCSVCKGSRWIELMPCGLVHPHVLDACDIDPDRFSGYAFGLGLSRLVMLRYGIRDIRWMMSGDLRFLEQFR